ncbi:hypothetical protein PV327_001759 [Microctonus hyperodae]|uniref:Aminopeptidase n=1 Tax=Microctonus hyperodae TaxID=165561 RepID=A0AA39KNG3_MICHY|nr:hypothetical protein PV327_001759 [Microctonus hyperodae]
MAAREFFLIFCVTTLAKQQLLESKFRLPRYTAPRLYIIEWDLNISARKFTFKGNSNITFEVLRPTATVTLHRSDKIDIDREFTEIIDEFNNTRKPIEQEWLSENEFYLIKFNSKLNIGNYTLKMKWSGRNAGTDWWNPFDGIFRIDPSSKDDNQYVVTSHFEPTGARNAFPCWDEPGMKAQFEISIIHHSNYTALSNMPVEIRKEFPDDKILTKFQRSPKMSSYLPCIAVSNYKKIENSHGNITMYANQHDLELVKHALEISEKIIPAMEQYTDIPYTLPKLDQIAVRKFPSMAMEHWGLVTYIDMGVMFKNSTLIPNTVVEDRVAFLVAHELAHQWFGNLVSPIWWEDIWLNEAFAAYYQYKAADMIFPDWNVMDFFAAEIVNGESFSEASTGELSTPIKWNPTDKTMIDKTFSSVTYSKGSAILHMMEHIIGEEIFRKGIQRYLKKHQFSAVTTDDLWTNLQVVYNENNGDERLLNIKETMDPWLEQKGYPILTVSRDYNTGLTNVSQKMARLYDVDNKWTIPLTYATESNPNFTSTAPMMWINESEVNVTIPNIDKDDWIILNIQQRGFYQVKYDYENWRKIVDYLNSDKYDNIHPVNRAQLLRDVIKLYKKDPKNINNRELLGNVTAYLHRETNLLPWMQSRDILKKFMVLVQNTPEEEIFTKYYLHLINKVMDYVGFNSQNENNHEAMRTQRYLASTACQLGHVGCQGPAKNYFDAYLNNPKENLLLCKTPSMENSLMADRVIGKERMRKNSTGTKRNEEAEALACMETNLIFCLPPPTQTYHRN